MNYEASGNLIKIIHYVENKNNSYWICLIINNTYNKYKIIGNVNFMPEIGDYITANGIKENNDYNEICINKSNIIISLPNTNDLICERLCKIYADINDISSDIINMLSNNENIWNLLDNQKLNEIIQLDNNTYKYLYNKYNEYISNRFNCEHQKLNNFLCNNSIIIKTHQIRNLIKKYIKAQSVIDIIIDKNDNYKILKLLDVESIGIKTLLYICNSLNMNDDKKINICIIHSLLNNPDGHTCLKKNELQILLNNFCNTHKITNKNFDDNLKNLENRKYIYMFEQYIYPKKYYEAEYNISKYLINLQKSEPVLSSLYSKANNYICNNEYLKCRQKRFEYSKNVDYVDNHKLDDKQKEACMQMFQNNFTINTGKAGTGKSSSIMIPLLFLSSYNNVDVLCLSPTGKACIRLNNEFKKPEYNFNYKAYTIHKFNYYYENYCKNEDEKENYIQDFDVILYKSNNIKLFIIDEFSMVDLLTFNNFIKKIKYLSNVCLMIVGDQNQLPSVSAGDILNKLLKIKEKKNIFGGVYLEEVYRNRGNDNGVTLMSDNVLNYKDLFHNMSKDQKEYVEWSQFDPFLENNKNTILNVINKDTLILSTTNKLIEFIHEDIKLKLNPPLDISLSIFNLKKEISKKNLKYLEKLEINLLEHKKLFDNKTIYKDRHTIYEFSINQIKNNTNNDINNNIKMLFDSKNFSLKNITNYLINIDLRQVNKKVREFINVYCKKFNEINKIFDNFSKYKDNKNLNYLFNLFNNDFNDFFEINNYKYRLYDKIMITKNNYPKKLMNGMICIIISFSNCDEKILIEDDDNNIYELYKNKDDLTNIKLSFAMTIHKSQGSESDDVIILVNDSRLNTINLLYTAITRSKKKCIIIGTQEVIGNIIKNKKIVKRNSNIHRLCEYFVDN